MKGPSAWQEWLALILSLAGILIVGVHIGHIPLNDDAGYFIPLARAMLDGQLPYLDVFNWHTPLGPVFLMPLARLAPETLIWAAPLYMAFWNLISAGLIARKVHAGTCNPYSALLASSFFLVMATLVDGYFVTLEPIYLPMMLAAWVMLDRKTLTRNQAIGAGLLLGIALMVKQFAVVGLVVLIPLSVHQKLWKAVMGGSVIVPLLVLGCFGINGMNLLDLILTWLRPPGVVAYLDASIDWWIASLLMLPLLLWMVGECWFLSRLLHSKNGGRNNRNWWNPLWLGIPGFLGLWFLGGNWQYLLPLIAWLVVGGAGHLTKEENIWKLGGMGIAIFFFLWLLWESPNIRNQQLALAHNVEAEIQPGEPFLIMGNASQYLYALTDCQPPMLREAGFQIYPMLESKVQKQVWDLAAVVSVFPSYAEEFDRQKEAFRKLELFPSNRASWWRRIGE